MDKLIYKPNPDFERIRITLLGGKADRVPACELGVDKPIKEMLIGRSIKTLADDIEFWYQAGYDYYLMRIIGRVPPDSRADKKFLDKYNINPNNPVTCGARSWVSNWQEFEEYPWQTEEDYNLGVLSEVAPLLPDGMKTIVNIGPFFSGIWRIMGFENFSFKTVEEPELVGAVADKIAEAYIMISERLLSHDHIQGIWMGDDLAFAESLMVPPSFYRKYIFPWEKQIGDMCRQAGKLFIRHSDGKLDAIMEDLIGCGYNALHPFEPKAMDIFKVKEEYGHRVALIGNVDVGTVLTEGTKEDVARDVKRKLRKLPENGGYALGSSNSVAEYIPFENYIEMLNTLHKYGKYPIEIPDEE